MAENKLPSIKSLLIFIIVLFALIVALITAINFPALKNYPPVVVQPTVAPTITMAVPTLKPTVTSIIEVMKWITYRNSDISVGFKYSSTLGTPEIFQTDNTNKKPENVFAGKKIDVYFKDADYNWFSFAAYTSDYQSFKDFFIFRGSDDINTECPNPFIYNNKGEACKIIEVADNKVIWKNYFNEDECSPVFESQIYFNNKSQSIYKGLSFTFNLKDAEKKVTDLYSCIDDKATELAYLEAVTQSKNIMERKNLSENDLQRLDIIDEILASFKFIK
ncbi:MAG: hypothetical protein Q8N37_02360 [bacterium]|nr:hypothetical protein [bacterium]